MTEVAARAVELHSCDKWPAAGIDACPQQTEIDNPMFFPAINADEFVSGVKAACNKVFPLFSVICLHRELGFRVISELRSPSWF